ncbi:hypothetical protein Vretimale_16482 [Volvox reticuliferus]|uniref:GrpE protein homolog n=1 Tax=Volvox reticuliferus TaxID=1737510 RepID=A0A8J4GR96_9CHLO|nr:hypothetical protein Vretifemale_17530 [Volvox reticuliferus]GIM13427.1 hypothetical protein Vretimale_16482 [Volvox reticuliferus]
MKTVSSVSRPCFQCPATSMRISLAPRSALLRCDGRVAVLAVRTAGRRRAVHAPITIVALSGQGPYQSGSGASMPGPPRFARQPRDLQQLVDVLSGGAGDDPEQFLQLLSAAPRVLEAGRALQSQPLLRDQDAATVNRAAVEQYARQLHRQQQQAAAAAAAAEARRRVQLAQEEEQRREALRAAMLQNARRHLPQYDTPSLARLASGLAAAGIRDPSICDEMLRQMVDQRTRQIQQRQQQPLQQPRQAASEPRSLAELLDAFAAMRHRPTDAQLAELLRLQQQEQQQAAEQERFRQAQAQQLLRSQPRLQPRGMVVPEPKPVPPPAVSDVGAGGSRMSPEDASRLLYALSRLGYSPDEGTLTQLLEQLQPQRLQLQPAQPASLQQPSPALAPHENSRATAWPHEQHLQQQREGGKRWPPRSQAATESWAEEVEVGNEEDQDADQRKQELQDELSYSLQRDAQAVASAVRALERMGRPDKAQQLREHFTRHVRDVQARVARERDARRQHEAAAAAATAERDRRVGGPAAAAATAAAERDRERKEAVEAALWERQQSELQRRQRQEEQTRALRQQLARQLGAADQWQHIRALLFTYQEAVDAECLTAAAARLAELLAASRRTGRGLAMTLRERGELGDLLEGLGQLVLRRLDSASAAQASSLLRSVVRMRHLEEGLLVGLLRRLRDTLDEAGGKELTTVLTVLAECGVRPNRLWMETFLGRCEELLDQFSPADLVALPVSLAQLGAHPGRSWLGSYLDVLQERESELSQSSVSEAVRAVAVLDRSFLSAWRQAAAVRQQQQQQQVRAAALAAATQQQEEQQRRQQAQLLQEQQYMPASALTSVDELLARPDGEGQEQRDESVQEEPLSSMQRMSEYQQVQPRTAAAEQQRIPTLQQRGAIPKATSQTQAGAEVEPSVIFGFNRLPEAAPMQSIELDVDAAERSNDGDRTYSPLPTEPAAIGPTTALPTFSGRQLPGSLSIDGFYNPEPYDDYDVNVMDWGDEVNEGANEDDDAEEDEEEPALEPLSASIDENGAPPGAAESVKAGPQSEPIAARLHSSAQQQQRQETHPPPSQQIKVQPSQDAEQQREQKQQQEPTGAEQKPKQLTPEDLAQARALRSLLLERCEAVAAYKDELEERRRRAAAAKAGEGEGSIERVISEREVAAAGKVLAAREQLQRLQADFDNFKRRASVEREQSLARAKAEALRPILSVADNFDRAAVQIKPKTDGERSVHNAYQAVYANLKEFLKKEGLQEVGVEGEAFDPNQHEAVMREDRDDVQDGTVTAVFQKGYRLGEVLIRPALVKVAYN